MDLNVRAFRVVQAATSGPSSTPPAPQKPRPEKLDLMVDDRAFAFSAQRRREIAQKASNARWTKTFSPGIAAVANCSTGDR